MNEREQSTAERSASEMLPHAFANLLPTAVYVCDLEGRITYYNERAAELWGRRPAVGEPDERYCGSYRLWWPDGRLLPHSESPMMQAIREGVSVLGQEVTIEHPDGRQLPVLVNIVPLRDTDGRIVGAINSFNDIVERKQQEEALRLSEERLRRHNQQLELLARVAQRMIVDDGDASEMLSAVFGEVAAAIGAEMYVGYQPCDEASMRLRISGGLDASERAQYETVRYGDLLCGRVALRRRPLVVEDIARTDVEGSEAVRAAGYAAYVGFPLLAGDRLLGTVAFVTRHKTHFAEGEVQTVQTVCDQVAAMLERARLAAELRESEERFRAIADYTCDWETWIGTDGRPKWINPAVERIAGVTVEACLQMEDYPLALVHPDDRVHMCERLAGALAGIPGHDVPFRIQRPDGAAVWGAMSWQPIAAADGRPLGYRSSVHDHTVRKRAEEALRIAGDSFRQLVEQSPFGVYAVDADFRLVMASAGARTVFRNVEPLFGRDLGEVLSTLWPAPFVASTLAHFRHTLVTGEPYRAPSTVELRTDIGETEAYDWKIERMILPDGRHGVVCHFYDLSERQRYEVALRASEHRYRTLLDASCAVTWSCPPDGRHDEPQLAWMAFTGQTAGEMLGEGWLKAVHPDDTARVVVQWRVATAERRRYSIEYRARRHDGEWRWMAVSAAPVFDAGGSIVEWFGMCFDITDRKQAEHALREADRKKDEFLATLAHELRNPLAPIRSGLDIIKLAGSDPLAVAKAREVMERQVLQMTTLLDDLMDVSRIARGHILLRKTTLPLADAVQNAVDSTRPLIDAQGHELVLDLPPSPIFVHGDLTRLSQVLANLLNNAAKYTPSGGRIRLGIERHADQAVMRVEDNGLGIPVHLLNSVFDLFTQVDRASNRTQDGLGIGLNIVKRLVEMHGGSIAASSGGHGMGSSFVVHLPVAEPPQTAIAAEARSPPPTLAAHRILVVDDNDDVADSLAMLLEFMGNETRSARDGMQAVAVAEAFEPDVILMDIGMPNLNGYEACRRIRAQPWGQHILMIAQTGWGQQEDRRSAMAAGFDLHMTKPIDPVALGNLLRDRLTGAADRA